MKLYKIFNSSESRKRQFYKNNKGSGKSQTSKTRQVLIDYINTQLICAQLKCQLKDYQGR